MSHDDFNFEPIRGLPETLPKDEHILWQGSPVAWRLAVEALALPWIGAYFAVLAIWRIGVSSTLVPLGEAVWHGVPFVLVGLIACLLIFGLAVVQARSTVYTLTNKRVAMRIGAALTMTLNLPYVKIVGAGVDQRRGGTGTIAFQLPPETRFSYLMTWPSVRPWHIARTQPALRCIPDVAHVAEVFAEAAEARLSQPQLSRRSANVDGPAVAAE